MVKLAQGYAIRKAILADLAAIMHVERQSFTAGIAESESVFTERLTHAPDCNFVLTNSQDKAVCGYFTAEIWEAVQPDAFALGHSVRERHCVNGSSLYISSFALLPEIRGTRIEESTAGLAETFFAAALTEISTAFPQLERIILLVHEDWHKAISIYKSQGFTCTQIVNGFTWFGGKQALIYEKIIQKQENKD